MTEKKDVDLLFDVENTESWLISLSRDLGKTLKRGKNGIDLFVDAAGSAFNTAITTTKKIVKLPRKTHDASPIEERLLEELGSRIAECPSDDCSSLKDDLEFWKLVQQLHAIKKGGKAAAEVHPPEMNTV